MLQRTVFGFGLSIKLVVRGVGLIAEPFRGGSGALVRRFRARRLAVMLNRVAALTRLRVLLLAGVGRLGHLGGDLGLVVNGLCCGCLVLA